MEEEKNRGTEERGGGGRGAGEGGGGVKLVEASHSKLPVSVKL